MASTQLEIVTNCMVNLSFENYIEPHADVGYNLGFHCWYIYSVNFKKFPDQQFMKTVYQTIKHLLESEVYLNVLINKAWCKKLSYD